MPNAQTPPAESACPDTQTLNFLGSKLSISALRVSPSSSISAMRHPVAGPFCIPQHVCPAATHRPGTAVLPTSGPRSSPNLMWRGR